MDAANSALKRIDKAKQQINDALSAGTVDGSKDSELVTTDVPKALENFEAAILDDLSMPRAAASLFGLVKSAENEFKRVAKDSSELLDLAGLQAIGKAMEQMDKVFGVFYQVPMSEEEEAEAEQKDVVPNEVLELVTQRTEAKEAKDWDLADSLRSRITELGFKVKDVKGGDPIVSRLE
jgi:cysteinyl-tRNA synthetase